MPSMPRLPVDLPSLLRWAGGVQRQLLSITPRSSPGLQVKRNAGGTTFGLPRARPARGGGGAAAEPVKYHPFQIIHVADGAIGDPGEIQVTTGFLGSDMAADSSETITGLNTTLDVEVDYLIFLRWDSVDGWDIVAEEGVDTNWPDYPDLVAIDAGPPIVQTNYWVLIGYVGTVPSDTETTPGFAITINGDPYWIYQCLRTDLLEQAICYNGNPAVYPFAHPAPFR